MKYIHYGHKEYDTSLFVEPQNKEHCNKPIGGLWGSPIDAERGWKQWCEDASFRECNSNNSFVFEIIDTAVIHQINCKADIEALPLQNSIITTWFVPDFEAIKKSGIDAIQFNLSSDTTEDYFDGIYYALYGWDCDCVLVLNKEVITMTK